LLINIISSFLFFIAIALHRLSVCGNGGMMFDVIRFPSNPKSSFSSVYHDDDDDDEDDHMNNGSGIQCPMS